MKLTMRDYQKDACQSVWDDWQSGLRRVMIKLPTGCGKTVIFLRIIAKLKEKGLVSASNPAVVIAHREELLTQPADAWLKTYGIGSPMSFERASETYQPGSEIVFASVASVGRDNDRLSGLRPGVVIIDECHHVAARSYHNALHKLNVLPPSCRSSRLLGCTATPNRLDKQAIVDNGQAIFEKVSYQYDIDEAITDGWLAPLVGYRVNTDVDLDCVKSGSGDLQEGQLAEAVDNASRTAVFLNAWKDYAYGRKTIVFAVNHAHAYHIAECAKWKFPELADKIFTITDRMNPAQRSGAVALYRNTPGAWMVNVEIATEGFDVADIGCVIMARPTKSSALYTQCVGRGTRLAPGKENCIVIDVADNSTKHKLAGIGILMGLSPKINLDGHSTSEVARMLRSAGGQAREILRADAESKRPQIDVSRFSDIRSAVQQVNLLTGLDVDSDVANVSRNRWARIGDDYYLSLKGGCSVRVADDGTGNYSMVVKRPSGIETHPLCVMDGLAAIKESDRFIRNDAELNGNRVQSGSWTKEPITDAQIGLLRKLGQNNGYIKKLTKGAAQMLISRIFEQRNSGNAAN